MKHRTVAIILLVSSAWACGTSTPPPTPAEAPKKTDSTPGASALAQQMAQSAEQSSQQMAAGLQQMAQGVQLMAKGLGKSVDYEALKALVPDMDGWTRSDTRGEELTLPMTYSRAQARYRKDDGRIEFEMTDTAQSQLLLAPMSMFLASGYSERSDDGFKQAVKIGGQPGVEEWNGKSRRGEVTMLVSNRFIVRATGHDVDSVDPVRQMVALVDVSRLGSMK